MEEAYFFKDCGCSRTVDSSKNMHWSLDGSAQLLNTELLSYDMKEHAESWKDIIIKRQNLSIFSNL